MHYHPFYGLVIPEEGWVPAPRYLLRRHRLLKLVEAMPRGRVLEVGCGTGALLYDLSRLGFSCVGYEASLQALRLAQYVHQDNAAVTIAASIDPDWRRNFDYLLAFEVLEHIEDDEQALATWHGWIKPGGCLLLSVPAHQKLWSDADVWAGHFRRYERKGIAHVLKKNGFQIERLECYGYPLANIVEPLRIYFYAKALRRETSRGSAQALRDEHNNRSGVERTTESRFYPLLASWLGVTLIRLACRVQTWFLDTDQGNGYLILARRASSRDS